MARLGHVTDYGCYKSGIKKSSIQYCHNCESSGGDEIRWTFEVLDDEGELIGHVVAALACKKGCGNESQQAATLRQIATGLLPA